MLLIPVRRSNLLMWVLAPQSLELVNSAKFGENLIISNIDGLSGF